MSQQYRMLNKKKELDLELKEQKNLLVKEKARCFKVLNGSEPYVPKFGASGQRILDEFNSLCEYYGIDPQSFNIEQKEQSTAPNSPTSKYSAKNSPKTSKTLSRSLTNNDDSNSQLINAFNSKMQSLIDETNDKKSQLAKLQQRFLVLQKQNNGLINEKRNKVVTIDKSFNAIKNQLNYIRTYFNDFVAETQSKIKLAKQMVEGEINEKRRKNQSQIDALDIRIDDLQTQKNMLQKQRDDKFARLSFQSLDDQSVDYVYSDEKLQEIIFKSAQKVQKMLEDRFKSSPINQKLDLIFQKTFDFSNKIDILIQRSNKLREERAQRLSALMISNWGVLTYSLLKLARYQNAIDGYYEEIKIQNDEIANQLKSENDLVNAKIPGTNFTIFEMRKEIIRLTNELKDLSKSKTEELKQIERQHSELRASSQKQIEELEAQID